jgi:hypothetical protein
MQPLDAEVEKEQFNKQTISDTAHFIIQYTKIPIILLGVH